MGLVWCGAGGRTLPILAVRRCSLVYCSPIGANGEKRGLCTVIVFPRVIRYGWRASDALGTIFVNERSVRGQNDQVENSARQSDQ